MGTGTTGRWARWVATVLAVGLGTAAAATGVVPAQAACIPVIEPCGGPAPPAVSEPSVTVGPSTVTGYTSAAVTGTVDPGGQATTYYWLYQDHADRAPTGQTGTFSVAASTGAEPVSASLTGLEPGVEYDLALVATNASGTVNAWTYGAFTTPQAPRLSDLVLSRPYSVAQNRNLSASVQLGGVYDTAAPVDLYASPWPYRRWTLAGSGLPARGGGRVRISICTSDTVDACPWLARNFRVRAIDGPARSKARTEYVYPSFNFTLVRENNGSSPFLDATVGVGVHYLPPGQRRLEPVYFYEGAKRSGRFTRVARSRLRIVTNIAPSVETEGGATLVASARIAHPGAGYTIWCLRHQLLDDMGKRFTDRVCGRATVG